MAKTPHITLEALTQQITFGLTILTVFTAELPMGMGKQLNFVFITMEECQLVAL